MVAMGQRHTGRGRAGHGRGNARRHLDGDAGGTDHVHFLATAAEDERIPALDAHHALALAGLADQDFANLLLRNRMMALGLADIDAVGIAAGQVQDRSRDQTVMHDHIGLAQQAGGLDRQQVRIAGTRADQVHDAGLFRCVTIQLTQHFPAGCGLVTGQGQVAGLAAQSAFPEGAAVVKAGQHGFHRAAQFAGEIGQHADAGRQDLLDGRADIHRQHGRRTARSDGDDNAAPVDNGRGLKV